MPRGPRISLGAFPTPVSRVEALSRPGATLWVKRDDLSSAIYGGNKVRKLELLLGAARAAGRSKLLTIGAVGSHQVVATAIYGKLHGFEVEAILVPQPSSPHARLNLSVALAHGLHVSDLQGRAIVFNQRDVVLHGGLVLCRPECASAILAITKT